MGVGAFDLNTRVFTNQFRKITHNGVRYFSSWEHRRSQTPIYNYDVVAYQYVKVIVFTYF